MLMTTIISLLDTQTYFDLLKPYPSNRQGVIDKFISENLIIKKTTKYSITNLGAIFLLKT
jgi:predicted transcriptional regulator